MRQFERSVVAANKYCTNRAQLLKQKKQKQKTKMNTKKKNNVFITARQPAAAIPT